jgi:MraZ protein
MFIGEYHNKLDEKGRIAIPVKFRNEFVDGGVVTRGLDGSLTLYPKRIWQNLAERLASLPLGQKEARSFARLILSGAMEVELDRQGRITLPQYLREYAGIRSEVVLAGLFDRVEIWSLTEWQKEAKDFTDKADELAKNIESLNI